MTTPDAAAVGGAGRPGRRRRRARAALRGIAAAAAVGALALLLWCAWLYARIAGFDGEPPENAATADVGIVLGASLWGDEPSPGLRERLDLAYELYEQGLFGAIIVTGGLDRPQARLTEAQGMERYLVRLGVPEERIARDDASTSTYENLKFAQDIMTERGWKSAVIITHRFHGSRAADVAGTLGYDPVRVRVADSAVLNMAYNRTREVLAYTKWMWDKRLLHGDGADGID